jgi:formate hydrogenlyase subunit 6/NADH:ubiquinone oxidoreductase subunit I
MIPELLKQLSKKPATNRFPASHLPPSITDYLAAVEKGEAVMNPPVPVPPNFKGKLKYERSTCTGCGICVRFCPAHALELIRPEKRIRVMIGQCIGCEQCTTVCPEGSLTKTDEFLCADTDRYSKAWVLE